MTTRKQRTKLFKDLASVLSKEQKMMVNVGNDGEIVDFEISAASGSVADRLGVIYCLDEITKLSTACGLEAFVKVKNAKPIIVIH